jgi:glycosyltransferase involved in cell wall biosynthesis
VRLAVYMDLPYRCDGEAIFAEVPFSIFLAGLSPWFEKVLLLGRLDASGRPLPHRLPPGPELVGLPAYESAASPLGLLAALPPTLRRFWTTVGEADRVLVFGPHPLSVLLVAIALLRGRAVVIGVRQHYPDYIRHRHPERRWLHLIGLLLEGIWQLYARFVPTVVVGPDLARSFRRARRLCVANISLVSESQLTTPERALSRDYDGELQVLSVGRLDPEKNPLLLADIAAALDGDRTWRLVVCGDGTMRERLTERVRRLGLAAKVDLRGYVPVDAGLEQLYRDSHMLLHVSLTEGMPQVFFEAFAAGLPVVATEVGGVGKGGERSALQLVPPEDAGAAAAALERVAAEPALRRSLVEAGLEHVRAHTLEAECRLVAAFVGSPSAMAAAA